MYISIGEDKRRGQVFRFSVSHHSAAACGVQDGVTDCIQAVTMRAWLLRIWQQVFRLWRRVSADA